MTDQTKWMQMLICVSDGRIYIYVVTGHILGFVTVWSGNMI